MALIHGSMHPISTKEKVESWMASTSAAHDPTDADAFTYEMPSHTMCQAGTTEVFVQPPHSPEKLRIAASSSNKNSAGPIYRETSCESIFRKYFPAQGSVGSKLIPGFQKAARRRQTISLLRKHAFRWANISYKKFVIIRTEGCNMIPWTDVREYFFPSCDDPSCEIILISLKYSLGFPKMSRHIHPCSQREQLRFGELFKVVPYGTILVDIDAVLNNKAFLWSMVEEMHSKSRASNKSPKCSYKSPERATESKSPRDKSSPSPPVPTALDTQRAHNNSPCGKDGKNPPLPADTLDPNSLYVFKRDKNFSTFPNEQNMVEFLGAQAKLMWDTMSEGNKIPARPSKSLSDATPPRPNQKVADPGVRKCDPSSSEHSFRNQHFHHSATHHDCDDPDDRRLVIDLAPEDPPAHKTVESGKETKVVGLRVNGNRFVPVVVPSDSASKITQNTSKWLVPIYLAQRFCLNTHVTGRLIGVYRDFIIGRSSRTPGKRGYTRLCTRLEGRNLTRWLYNMSEKAGLIPTWTIVTSRCLLIQWKDFLEYVSSDTIQTYKLDPALSFQFPPTTREQVVTAPCLPDEVKSVDAPCNSVKTSLQPTGLGYQDVTSIAGSHRPLSQGSLAWEERPSSSDNRLTSGLTPPILETDELPSAQLREEEMPDWAKCAHEEVDWNKADLEALCSGQDFDDILAKNDDCVSEARSDKSFTKGLVEKDKVASLPSIFRQNFDAAASIRGKRVTESVVVEKGKGFTCETAECSDVTENKCASGKKNIRRKQKVSSEQKCESEKTERNKDKEQFHVSDTAMNIKSKKRRSRTPKKRTTLEVKSPTPTQRKADEYSQKSPITDLSPELVNPNLYEKFVHRRRQKGEARLKTTDMQLEAEESKTETGKMTDKPTRGHDTMTISHSPRKTKVETAVEKSGRRNRFRGLSLWGEEDEISEMGVVPDTSSSSEKKRTPSGRAVKKTVSWVIPGVYPRSDKGVENKLTRNDKKDFDKKHVRSPSDFNISDGYNVQYSLRNGSLKLNSSLNDTPEKRTFVKSKPLSCKSPAREPRGTFKGRTVHSAEPSLQIPYDEPENLNSPVKTEDNSKSEQTSIPTLVLGENFRKPNAVKHHPKTVSKRLSLSSLDDSLSKGVEPEEIPVNIKTSPSRKESTKYSKRKRSFAKDGIKSKASQSPAVAAPQKGKGKNGRAHAGYSTQDSKTKLRTAGVNDCSVKIQVDRTEVTESSSSIVEQQKKLLEVIKRQRKPKSAEKKGRVQTPKKYILKKWNASKPMNDESPIGISNRPVTACTSDTRDCSIPSGRSSQCDEVCSSRDPGQKIAFSFQPLLDPGQSVSNRGLAMFYDCSVPYVAMNGYKYITLKDATLAFPRCKPNCGVTKSVLRSHRGLHKTMCSWDQVYDFELTQPNRRPPVRTGDVLLRFDTLMNILPIIEDELPRKHHSASSKKALSCDY